MRSLFARFIFVSFLAASLVSIARPSRAQTMAAHHEMREGAHAHHLITPVFETRIEMGFSPDVRLHRAVGEAGILFAFPHVLPRFGLVSSIVGGYESPDHSGLLGFEAGACMELETAWMDTRDCVEYGHHFSGGDFIRTELRLSPAWIVRPLVRAVADTYPSSLGSENHGEWNLLVGAGPQAVLSRFFRAAAIISYAAYDVSRTRTISPPLHDPVWTAALLCEAKTW